MRNTGLFKKKEDDKIQSIDAKEASNEKSPKVMGRKSEVGKTEQQIKLNQQQNKRRLFNRKSGE